MIRKLLLLTLFVGHSVMAQTNDYSWQNAANGDPVPANTGGSGGTTNPGGALTTFLDLASFQAAAPMATNFEDLETNNAGGAFQVCTAPVSSSSDDNCFTPGQFVDGVTVNPSTAGNDLVLLPPGSVPGLVDFVMGAITFADTTILDFSGGDTFAVAMDIYAGQVTGDVEVTFRNSMGMDIGVVTVVGIGGLPDNAFLGVISDEPIAQVEINGIGDNGELFDNLLFGSIGADLPPPPVVPALQNSGLIALILILAAVSLFILARRRQAGN